MSPHRVPTGPAPLAALALALGVALSGAPSAKAAELASARLLSVAKDSATLRVDLTAPETAAVSWGEQPGDWKGHAAAGDAAESHEFKLTGLSPTRRYFYQLEIGGVPQGDIATFTSGRSWVSRQATILVAAAAADASPESAALADALFAREADVLVLLGGEGDPSAFLAQHGRALADRVVVTGPDAPAPAIPVADVVLAWTGAASLADAKAAHGACWTVALGGDAPDADLVIARGEASAIGAGERPTITIAGHDSLALSFASGVLTATLVTPGGPIERRIERACAPPPAQRKPEDDVPDELEVDVDGSGHSSECDMP